MHRFPSHHRVGVAHSTLLSAQVCLSRTLKQRVLVFQFLSFHSHSTNTTSPLKHHPTPQQTASGSLRATASLPISRSANSSVPSIPHLVSVLQVSPLTGLTLSLAASLHASPPDPLLSLRTLWIVSQTPFRSPICGPPAWLLPREDVEHGRQRIQ
jgi:hypothetical protein